MSSHNWGFFFGFFLLDCHYGCLLFSFLFWSNLLFWLFWLSSFNLRFSLYSCFFRLLLFSLGLFNFIFLRLCFFNFCFLWFCLFSLFLFSKFWFSLLDLLIYYWVSFSSFLFLRFFRFLLIFFNNFLLFLLFLFNLVWLVFCLWSRLLLILNFWSSVQVLKRLFFWFF